MSFIADSSVRSFDLQTKMKKKRGQRTLGGNLHSQASFLIQLLAHCGIITRAVYWLIYRLNPQDQKSVKPKHVFKCLFVRPFIYPPVLWFIMPSADGPRFILFTHTNIYKPSHSRVNLNEAFMTLHATKGVS